MLLKILTLLSVFLSFNTFATVISPFAKNKHEQKMYQSQLQIQSRSLNAYSSSKIEFESDNTNLCGHTFQNDYNVLIITVEYNNQDLLFNNDEIYNSFFNQNDSVSHYYKEATNNQINITPALNGNIQGILNISLNKNHPGSLNDDDFDTTSLMREDVKTIFDKIINDELFDFKTFDTNQNNILESNELGIQFIVAGYEEAYSGDNYTNSVWAHESSLYYLNDGLFISQYAVAGERLNHPNLNMNDQIFQKGIIAHELGHLLFCLPDLYEINENYRFSGNLGDTDLMASGSWNRKFGEISGASPAHFSTFSLYKMNLLDINNLTEMHNHSDTYDINFNSPETNTVYHKDFHTSYFFEARGKSGYDSALENSGVVVTHMEEKNGKYILTNPMGYLPSWDLNNLELDSSFYINISNSDDFHISLKTTSEQVDNRYKPDDYTGENIRRKVGSGSISFTFLFSILLLLRQKKASK